MSNVTNFTGITVVPEPADKFLEKAKTWGLDTCVVVGLTNDGDLAAGSNISDVAELVLLLERAKKDLIEGLE